MIKTKNRINNNRTYLLRLKGLFDICWIVKFGCGNLHNWDSLKVLEKTGNGFQNTHHYEYHGQSFLQPNTLLTSWKPRCVKAISIQQIKYTNQIIFFTGKHLQHTWHIQAVPWTLIIVCFLTGVWGQRALQKKMVWLMKSMYDDARTWWGAASVTPDNSRSELVYIRHSAWVLCCLS